MYTGGAYLANNPTWHVEASHWKAAQILRMMQRNGLRPRTVCEVGCGAGEILRQLQLSMATDCLFLGYEISPQAFYAALALRADDSIAEWRTAG